MKTIIIKSNSSPRKELSAFIKRLEKYIDRTVENAVICTRFIDADNYYTIHGEVKDAVTIDDFDIFIIGVCHPTMDMTSVQNLNKAHTLICDIDDFDSAKNFVIML